MHLGGSFVGMMDRDSHEDSISYTKREIFSSVLRRMRSRRWEMGMLHTALYRILVMLPSNASLKSSLLLPTRHPSIHPRVPAPHHHTPPSTIPHTQFATHEKNSQTLHLTTPQAHNKQPTKTLHTPPNAHHPTIASAPHSHPTPTLSPASPSSFSYHASRQPRMRRRWLDWSMPCCAGLGS